MSLCLEMVQRVVPEIGQGWGAKVSSTLVPALGQQEVGADSKVKKQRVISANSHHQDKHTAPGFSSGGSSGQLVPSCHPAESAGLSQR